MPLWARTRHLFSRTFRVEGPSMVPLHQPGSSVRIQAFAYLWSAPRRGDVVALLSPQSSDRIELKRVVGLPKEHISWNGTAIWINGILLTEPYLTKSIAMPGDDRNSGLVLAPYTYFVVGDNRLHSQDSRDYGPVPTHSILGKAR